MSLSLEPPSCPSRSLNPDLRHSFLSADRRVFSKTSICLDSLTVTPDVVVSGAQPLKRNH
jgi:hypothetical protein